MRQEHKVTDSFYMALSFQRPNSWGPPEARKLLVVLLGSRPPHNPFQKSVCTWPYAISFVSFAGFQIIPKLDTCCISLSWGNWTDIYSPRQGSTDRPKYNFTRDQVGKLISSLWRVMYKNASDLKQLHQCRTTILHHGRCHSEAASQNLAFI